MVDIRICNSYYISDLDVTNYIIDSTSLKVKTVQLYKDKATPVDETTKYKTKHNLNFKINKSDKKNILL